MTTEVSVDEGLMTITITGEEYECVLRFTYELDELVEQGAVVTLNNNGVTLVFSCEFMIDQYGNDVEIVAAGMDGCGNRCECCESSHHLTVRLPDGQLKKALQKLGWS